MLRSMSLENFKAFGSRTSIPLAPITLIFGENSAGKSSILQSLYLLKQTRESRNVDAPLLPRAENGLIDLGSFQELVFDHNLSNYVSIRLDTGIEHTASLRPLDFKFPKILRGKKSIGLDFTFSRTSLQDEITLESLRLCGDKRDDYIAEFAKLDLSEAGRLKLAGGTRTDRRIGNKKLTAVQCTLFGGDREFLKSSFSETKSYRDELIRKLEAANTKISNMTNSMLGNFFGDSVSATRTDYYDKRSELQQYIKTTIGFLSTDFSFSQYLDWMRMSQRRTIVVLDGFIPLLSRSLDGNWSVDDILYRLQNRTLVRREWTADIGYACVYAGELLEKTLSSLFPLGPVRQAPARWYIFTGTTPRDVGYQGNLLPDLLLRHGELLSQTNEWLHRLDIGYELEPRQLGVGSTDFFELRLRDKRRGTSVDVGLADVGYGISQILPLVVQSLAASHQIITVEQPEVHIHPRLQADIGDLLIESIQEPRKNQFIIETHSEHLALRLQRRIREKYRGLSPKDVSILYVSRGVNGASVMPLRLDEEGDFIDDFPGGFFPERLRELR